MGFPFFSIFYLCTVDLLVKLAEEDGVYSFDGVNPLTVLVAPSLALRSPTLGARVLSLESLESLEP